MNLDGSAFRRRLGRSPAGLLLLLAVLWTTAVLWTGCTAADPEVGDATTSAQDATTTPAATTVASGDDTTDTTAEVTVPEETTLPAETDAVETTDDTIDTIPTTEETTMTDTTDYETTTALPEETTAVETETETEIECPYPDSGYPVGYMAILDTPIEACGLAVAEDLPAGLANALNHFLDYMERATGVRLPLNPSDGTTVIAIGETALDTPDIVAARAELGEEGYTIRTGDGCLYITGATERGTIYGLYAFLEDYVGWRFLSSDCQVVHKTRAVLIPRDLCVTSTPGFEYRGLLWYDCLSDPDQTNALRLNSTFMRDLNKYGGGMAYGGGFVHTLAALAEMQNPQVGEQPCLTDENVYRTVLKNVRAILEAYPDVDIISVSQNDSDVQHKGCQCENCRAIDEREGTPMGSLLTFVNRIADDIRDDYPNVYIDTLAYRYTRKAPRTIKPADNVIIRLCSIECCFSHPIGDETCRDNVAFCRDIEDWAAICDRLYIWDYTTDFRYYLAPFPNFGVLWDNVQFFRDNHTKGLFEQGNYQSISGEFDELRSYLLAHLLWNPDMTKEEYYAMMDEFLADYYGPGWAHIRHYIDWTTTNAARRHLHIYDSSADVVPQYNADGKRDRAVLSDMVALWDAALAEAETEEQRAHVERSRMAAVFNFVSAYPSHPGDHKQQLLETIRKYGLTHLHEGGAMPAEIDYRIDPKYW